MLGPIIRLQIQRSPLKTGEKQHKKYDPSPILALERLQMGPDGAIAVVDGRDMLDVHHRSHPSSKNDDGLHAISVGFTGHYRAMQARYGEHMVVGCAGENIIVEHAGQMTLDDVAGGFVVLSPDGKERLRLGRVDIAHPCKPFSGFAHRHEIVEPEVLKATLKFLDEGTRGFRVTPETEAEVRVGDLLAVIS
ncbi:MAG: hypothetical protein EXR93_02475 [Gemmatimonadetes bacterium]|nr:hypothetical protein [Gemmatimonadota bacterium]